MVQKVIITDYPDGSRVMSNIRNKKGVPVFKENDTYTATRVTTWYDGTPMDDSKADGKVYLKHTSSGEYYRVNLPNDGELFLEKDTVDELRAMSNTEILLLKMGYYKGVTLNGYYNANDTPGAIQYYLSDTTEVDDGGSVFEVGGIKLEHEFKGEIDIKYFGMFNGTSDDTDKLNHISNLAGNLGCKMIIPNTVNPFMIFPRLRGGEGSVRSRGFIPKSNVEYIFETGARFKIIPVPNNSYCGISIYNIENTVFRNLTIIGERDEHYFGDNPNNKYVMFENNKSYASGQYVESGENGWIVTVSGISDPTTSLPTNTGTVTIGQTITNGTATFQVVALNLGQWGHCIEIYESKNITFYDLKANKAWGDGVFIGVTDGTSEEDMNNQINFLGNTQSINCRRQAISVITARNSYIESLYAEDVKGHQPMAAIDFEPNFDWHVIDNFYVNQVTAVRCHRSTQFSSRSNFYDVTINNVNAIDCDLPPTFEGLQHTAQRVIPSRITINNWNVNTLNNIPPVRMYNWYPDFNGYVNIGNINIGNWQIDSAGSSGSFLNLIYSRPSSPDMIDMGGVTIDNYNVSKYSINPSVELRPFFLSFNNTTVDDATRIGKINLNIPTLFGVNVDDSNTNIPIDISTVNVRKKQSTLSNVFRSTGTTLLIKNGDYVYQSNPTLSVTISRRGFKEAIIVNSSSSDKVMTMVGAPSSGITTFTGQGGISQSGNIFTISPSSVVKITRISDSEIIVALMNVGNRNASSSIKGLVNQSVAQANISQADLAAISTVDGSDAGTTQALANAIKAYINANVIPLVNAIKESQNTELANQRTAGQQAT